MPWRLLYYRVTDWWAARTKLEITLLIILIAIVLFGIITSHSIANKRKRLKSDTCTTSECIKYSAKLMRYMDPSVHPCDDFYKFSCGNFKKNSYREERMSIRDTKMQDLLELYKEPVDEKDHIMVKSSKMFFQTCVNETGLKEEGLKTIKSVLKELGGWPVLEGDEWIDEEFHWLDVTYKLRNFGYDYSIFFGLKLFPDPDDGNSNIPKIYVEDIHQYSHENDKIEFVDYMTNIAMQFGGTSYTEIHKEFKKVYQFLRKFEADEFKDEVGESFKYRISNYQQLSNSVNWLEFINNILHPVAKLSDEDYILFPSQDTTSRILSTISDTPKRTVANYMIWKVVESSLPFLYKKLRNLHMRYTKTETPEIFCLNEIENMYELSPMKIMLDIKYTTPAGAKFLEDYLLAFKAKFTETLKSMTVFSPDAKEEILETVRTVALVSGIPSNHTAEGMLDELNVDMVEPKNESLLNLYAQINKNRESANLKQIGGPKLDTFLWKLRRFNILEPAYLEFDHEVVLPTVMVDIFGVSEGLPNYVNYGVLGAIIGTQFGMILFSTNVSDTIFWKETTRVREKLGTHKFDNEEIRALGQQILSQKMSYEVYEDWMEKRSNEKRLADMKYTQNQLFWMSFAFPFCYLSHTDVRINALPWQPRLTTLLISNALRANPDFNEDFHCF